MGLLTPLRRLYPLPVRQASTLPAASFRFRLATDTLAVQLTLPLAGCVEDFHLQVIPPATTAGKIAPVTALRAMPGAHRVGDGVPPVALSHHRTCGSASGGFCLPVSGVSLRPEDYSPISL